MPGGVGAGGGGAGVFGYGVVVVVALPVGGVGGWLGVWLRWLLACWVVWWGGCLLAVQLAGRLAGLAGRRRLACWPGLAAQGLR